VSAPQVPEGRLAATATRFQFLPDAIFVGDPMDTADLHNPVAITVDWRGGDRWAVLRGPGWSPQLVWCEQNHEWEYEPLPSSRGADFLVRCRYSLDDAMRIAERLANEPKERP
jgi:hypothetical protein